MPPPPLFINTSAIADITDLTKARLLELQTYLHESNPLSREQLIAVGEELLKHAKHHMHQTNFENILYMLREDKIKNIQEAQNVFAGHVDEALRGKKGGKRRKSRKVGKRKNTRKSRTHCH
jgi:hypothetical protein